MSDGTQTVVSLMSRLQESLNTLIIEIPRDTWSDNEIKETKFVVLDQHFAVVPYYQEYDKLHWAIFLYDADNINHKKELAHCEDERIVPVLVYKILLYRANQLFCDYNWRAEKTIRNYIAGRVWSARNLQQVSETH